MASSRVEILLSCQQYTTIQDMQLSVQLMSMCPVSHALAFLTGAAGITSVGGG